jgi:hypothetical protein
MCLKYRIGGPGLDLSGLGCVPMAGVCEYGIELFRLFLDYLKN